jgi:hypothetical protein
MASVNYFELFYRHFGAEAKKANMLDTSVLTKLKREKIDRGLLAGVVNLSHPPTKPKVRQVGDSVIFLYADKYLAPLELNLHVGFVAEDNKELYYKYRRLFENLIKKELAVKL